MIELSFALACIGAFSLGFFFRTLWDKVKRLESNIESRVKSKEPEPESTFLDPDDPIQQVRFEQQEIQRKLNPELYSNQDE